jgi:methionyl-tRNA formyltransferase
MIINILTDDPKSWFVPYGKKLEQKLVEMGHMARYVHNGNDVKDGDVCFLLSCVKLTGEDILDRNKNNIVVHASDLPFGKGFSPMQWQILNEKNELVLTLFEAVKEVDAGPYYLKKKVVFNGSELLPQLHAILAGNIIDMCLEYTARRDSLKPVPMIGEGSYFRKIKDTDDEIDVNRTILQNFNHFRIADNEKHPLYFLINGNKYYLKIYDSKTAGDGNQGQKEKQ